MSRKYTPRMQRGPRPFPPGWAKKYPEVVAEAEINAWFRRLVEEADAGPSRKTCIRIARERKGVES